MDFEELKTKSAADLKELIVEQVALLRDLRFKLANQQLKTVRKIKEARKTIARVKTLLAVKSEDLKKK